ncbi:MAG: hypothetical protein WC732_08005 [Candidatus Omnitrophota bacterium]
MGIENPEIPYEALKQRGFLRQKQEGFFVLRTRMDSGIYTAFQLDAVQKIALKYARGMVHATTRQGLEVPFIRLEDIDSVERELKAAGVFPGASGPRLRAITVCPGNNWCKSGLVNTFNLAKRIESELGIGCGMELPHKFKIAIAGCPNACTRPQGSEIGIHGAAAGGYVVYLAGSGGRTPVAGFKLDRIYREDEVLALVKKVVSFFKEQARPRQRLAHLVSELGKEAFLNQLGI